jgi:hypothetical protein
MPNAQNNYIRVRNKKTHTTGFDMSMVHIKDICEYIDGLSATKSTYRKVVLNHHHWQALYDVKSRHFWYKATEDNGIQGVQKGDEVQKFCQSVACKKCGIILPLELITIDHRNPQAGGKKGAMQKLFRAYGLSQDLPVGQKGTSILNGMPDEASLPHPQATVVPPPAESDLNWKGMIVFSLLVTAKMLTEFEDQALHHFVNLQPMCSKCNPSKSNQ